MTSQYLSPTPANYVLLEAVLRRLELQDWRGLVLHCQRHHQALTGKQILFLMTLAERGSEPSRRQLRWLLAIAEHVERDGQCRAGLLAAVAAELRRRENRRKDT